MLTKVIEVLFSLFLILRFIGDFKDFYHPEIEHFIK